MIAAIVKVVINPQIKDINTMKICGEPRFLNPRF